MGNVIQFRVESAPWNPHAYQKKAVKFLVEHAAGALLLDPGLGKTSITMAAIKLLKKKGLINKVLIIAPLRVCHSVWPVEAEKWTDFNGLRVVALHGPNKDKLLESEADIYVINHEGLEWLLQMVKTRTKSGKTKIDVDRRRWKKFGFDTLVIDELSRFKNSGTNQFKALKLIIDMFGRRWGLTGSPAANGLENLFSQCYLLDQGNALGKYITHFRAKYFVPNPKVPFAWILQAGAEEKIYERLHPLALRMAANDYLDMPTLINNNIKVELPEKARRVYDELEDELITKLDEGTIVASNAGVASMKCRQVANGGIYLDPDVQALIRLPKSRREWVNLHTEKVDALADLIDELQGSPLLVAYDFAHDLDRLQTRLGREVPYIGGGVSTKRAAELERDWNSGKLPVLLGHPQSIAFGLNLQEVGHHVAWHSLTWDFEIYDQFIRRVLRQGNKSKKVFVHHLIASGTVDEIMMSALRSKNRGQQAFFEGLKNLSKGRK